MIKSLVLFMFVGCAQTSQKTMLGPDGTKHKLITCGAVEHCYEKATELCNTYKIANTTHESFSGTDGKVHTVTKLLVKCETR